MQLPRLRRHLAERLGICALGLYLRRRARERERESRGTGRTEDSSMITPNLCRFAATSDATSVAELPRPVVRVCAKCGAERRWKCIPKGDAGNDVNLATTTVKPN